MSGFVVVGVDGSERFPVTDGQTFGGSHRWALDSRTLAFVSTMDGPPRLYAFDVQTRAVTPLSGSLPGFPSNLAWSPDGSRLAFSSGVLAPRRTIGETIEAPEGATWHDPPIVIDRLSRKPLEALVELGLEFSATV